MKATQHAGPSFLSVIIFSTKKNGIKVKKTIKSLNPTIKPPNQAKKDQSLKWFDFKSPVFNLKLTKL